MGGKKKLNRMSKLVDEEKKKKGKLGASWVVPVG